MSKSTVLVAIDDTDTARLQYSGAWAKSNNVVDNIGFSGATLDSTLHEGSASGSTVNFEFDGTAVGFFGSLTTGSNSTVPKYTCRIDGITFDVNWKYGIQQTNQYPLCEQIYLPDGHHKASLTIDDVSDGVPLLLDYVGYWPSPGAKLNDTVQQVQFNDSSIAFSAGWSVYGEYEYHHYSSQKSTTVSINFDGQSLIMYAFIPNGTFTSGTGSYVLDGGSPTSFTVPASKSTINAYYNYPYFNITGLGKGNHTVVVTDNTDHNKQSPMTASYFEVRGHPASGSSAGGGLSTGAIAGIAVGGAGVLGLIAGLLVWFIVIAPRRRKKHGVASEEKLNMPPTTPFTPNSAQPFLSYNQNQPSPQHSNFQGGFMVPQQTPHMQTVAAPPSRSSTNPGFPVPDHYPSSEGGFNPYGPPGPGSSVAGSSSVGHHPSLTAQRNTSYSQYSPPSTPGEQHQQVLTRTDSGGGTRMSWRPPNQSYRASGKGGEPVQEERIVEHVDSGMRMNQDGGYRVVDVPPSYQPT